MENIGEFLKELTALSHRFGIVLRTRADGWLQAVELERDTAGHYTGGDRSIFWTHWSRPDDTFEQKLRHNMMMVLNGTWKVKTFYYWLIGKSWNEDLDLANHVTLILAEWTSKHRTDEDVIHEFGEILRAA